MRSLVGPAGTNRRPRVTQRCAVSDGSLVDASDGLTRGTADVGRGVRSDHTRDRHDRRHPPLKMVECCCRQPFADVAWSRTPELARFERSQTSPSARTEPLGALSPFCRSVLKLTAEPAGGWVTAPTVESEVSVPRHTHVKQSQRRASPTAERGGGSGTRRRGASGAIDAQALALREAGKSFSAIARTLELDRATEAHKCYLRALGTHEGDDLRQLIKNEEARLDELERRIRERDAADTSKLERRLLALQNLRETIRA